MYVTIKIFTYKVDAKVPYIAQQLNTRTYYNWKEINKNKIIYLCDKKDWQLKELYIVALYNIIFYSRHVCDY